MDNATRCRRRSQDGSFLDSASRGRPGIPTLAGTIQANQVAAFVQEVSASYVVAASARFAGEDATIDRYVSDDAFATANKERTRHPRSRAIEGRRDRGSGRRRRWTALAASKTTLFPRAQVDAASHRPAFA
jgi:hypothetical protein